MFRVVNRCSTNYRFCITQLNARSVFTGKQKVQNESKSVRGESKEAKQSTENTLGVKRDINPRDKVNKGKSNDTRQEKSFTKTFKEMSHDSQQTPKPAINASKCMIVPRVPSTEYIRDDSIHIEGLFAGYRPLFLGNSSIPTEGNSLSTERESILLKSKGDADTSGKKLVVPWNASISGIKYKEEAFHRLPTSLVSRLRPFKFEPDSDMSGAGKKRRRNEMVVMKVHNSKINDRSELVDIFNLKKGGTYHPLSRDSVYGGMTKRDLEFRKTLKKQKNEYNNELQSFAYDYKFIRDDQIRFRDTIQTLNEELIDKFEEVTGLKLQLQSREQNLPLFIYFQQNIATKRRLKTIFKSAIKFQTDPILYSLLQDFETKEQSEEFQNKFKDDVKKIILNLIERIPSLSFVDTTKAVDCIILKSPVPGFRRIHWLDASKRLTTMSKFNSDKEYTFSITRNQKITRTGMRSTRRPVQIYGKTVNEVFKEWDYYTY
ncbi:MIOREX complex component 6 [Monosporozyma servazzii]